MKSLLFAEWRHSSGATRKWAALAAAATISCFPVTSVFADNHGHGGGGHPGGGGGHQGGGGHGGGGGHPGGGHGGGAMHAAGGGGHGGGGGHPGGGHGGGAPHMASGGHGGSQHFNAGRQAAAGGGHFGGSHNFAGTHGGSPSHQAGGHQNHSVSSNTEKSLARQNRSNGAVDHRAVTQAKHTAQVTNRTLAKENNSRTRSLAEAQKIVHQNRGERLKSRALLINRTGSFDRSITRTRANRLLNRRLNQISTRTWSGRGQFYANRFDPGNHCWYRHGNYWWRCNYWGAHAYCNRLITIGFAPGICWDWYDDICWGNIVVGMPLDLVDYYYPDPVYTAYITWDGEDATVYYYSADDGQYKRVTVVDGDVVDVQIVAEITYS
jgi:hypothetical protein